MQETVTSKADGLNWALVAFPLLVSMHQNRIVEVGALGLLLALSLVSKPVRRTSLGVAVPLILIVGVGTCMSLLRGGSPMYLVGLMGVVIALLAASRRCPASVFIPSLMAGISVYLLANILGWAIGIHSPGAAVRVALYESDSLFGQRVFFPFSRSINEPAIPAAALIGYIIVARRLGMRSIKYPIGGLVMAAFVLVGSGSRFPLILLVAGVAVATLAHRFVPLLPNLTVVLIGLPFYIAAVSPVIEFAARRGVELGFIARGQTVEELAGFSSRGEFWSLGISNWPTYDSLQHLVGFGDDGHVVSGVVFAYYHSGFVTSLEALTLHNSYLQQMYNTGYVGLACLIAGLFLIAYRARSSPPLAVAACVLIGIGTVESFLVPQYQTIALFLLLAISLAPFAEMRLEKKSPPKSVSSPRPVYWRTGGWLR